MQNSCQDGKKKCMHTQMRVTACEVATPDMVGRMAASSRDAFYCQRLVDAVVDSRDISVVAWLGYASLAFCESSSTW